MANWATGLFLVEPVERHGNGGGGRRAQVTARDKGHIPHAEASAFGPAVGRDLVCCVCNSELVQCFLSMCMFGAF